MTNKQYLQLSCSYIHMALTITCTSESLHKKKIFRFITYISFLLVIDFSLLVFAEFNDGFLFKDVFTTRKYNFLSYWYT